MLIVMSVGTAALLHSCNSLFLNLSHFYDTKPCHSIEVAASRIEPSTDQNRLMLEHFTTNELRQILAL